MATFLQLVNDVERESGTIAQTQRLKTVVNPIGRQEKIVHWTAMAWEAIQRERGDWTFMRSRFTAPLIVGQVSYTAASLGLTGVSRWLGPADGYAAFTLYDPDLGKGDETRLQHLPYRTWADMYDVGAPTSTRPTQAAIGPDNTINVGPPPDKAYVLRGWYRRSIQTLAADADVPFIDPDYHDAIVWRALVMLSEHEEAAFQIGAAGLRYNAVRADMLRAFTEPCET